MAKSQGKLQAETEIIYSTGDAETGVALARRWLRSAELLQQRLGAAQRHRGLNESRSRTLRELAARGEGLSQTELANCLSVSESNLSALIERMRKDGLLHRLRSKADRRRSVLLLTEEGRRQSTQAFKVENDLLAETFGEVSASAQAALCHFLDDWEKTCDQQSPVADPSARMREAA